MPNPHYMEYQNEIQWYVNQHFPAHFCLHFNQGNANNLDRLATPGSSALPHAARDLVDRGQHC